MHRMSKVCGVWTLTLSGSVAVGLSGCSADDWFVRDHSAHASAQTGTGSEPDVALQSAPQRLDSVIVADRPPPAISGGTLAVTDDGTLAVAADSDRDRVYLVSTAGTNQSRTVKLDQGTEPGRVVLDGSGAAHVALRGKGGLVRIDLQTAAVTHTAQVCALPRGVALDAAQNTLWVACAGGELISIDASTYVERSRTFVQVDLRDIVIRGDGHKFVSCYRSAELLEIDDDGHVHSHARPDDTHTLREDEDTNVISVRASAALAWRTVRAANGSTYMLHQQSQDDEVVISQAGGYTSGALGCSPITQPSITRYDERGGHDAPILLGGAALAVDVAASNDGRWLAVAKPGAFLRGERASLEVISTSSRSGDGAPLDGGVALDAGPSDLFTQTADGSIVFDPTNFIAPNDCNTGWGDVFDAQTTAVAFDAQGRLYAFTREPAELRIFAEENDFPNSDFIDSWASFVVQARISLDESSVRDTGHELFHSDVGSGLACASCHGEALDDGHVWNFKGFGPRRTQNMRGGLLQTLPLHWEGDLPKFQNLVDEVMTKRMGGFHVDAKYGDALANWIDKQPALHASSTDAAATARGKALFDSSALQCRTCHSGETFTNNKTVDVGTGGEFQVPSLRGLGLHAPYMHDGCAPTLRERFDPSCGGGDKHGRTSDLTSGQIDDLVAYLQTL